MAVTKCPKIAAPSVLAWDIVNPAGISIAMDSKVIETGWAARQITRTDWREDMCSRLAG